mgnify:CR=1 FL=1
MNGFVIVAGILLAGILAFLLRPLLGRQSDVPEEGRARAINLGILREQKAELEQQRAGGQIDEAAYRQACEELERRALEDIPDPSAKDAAGGGGRRSPKLALALAGGMAATVVGLYLVLGEPGVLAGKPAATAKDGSHALGREQILAMVEKLSEKLQANPNDGAGWLMLARSYSVLQRYPESVAAYGRAAGLMPPDAQMMADYADTVAMVQGRRLQGEPEKLVRRALEIDPNNMKALALSGTAAFERQDYRGAIAEWRKVLALVPPESNVARGMQGSIMDAESRLAAAGGSATATAGGTRVSGIVALDPSLSGKVAPTDTVFVFARAEQGPKMPLAILRKTVADLPLRFELDDSMAMSPNFRLSRQASVVVGARISRQGDAQPRAGDWQGLAEPVAPGSEDVKIVINSLIQ